MGLFAVKGPPEGVGFRPPFFHWKRRAGAMLENRTGWKPVPRSVPGEL